MGLLDDMRLRESEGVGLLRGDDRNAYEALQDMLTNEKTRKFMEAYFNNEPFSGYVRSGSAPNAPASTNTSGMVSGQLGPLVGRIAGDYTSDPSGSSTGSISPSIGIGGGGPLSLSYGRNYQLSPQGMTSSPEYSAMLRGELLGGQGFVRGAIAPGQGKSLEGQYIRQLEDQGELGIRAGGNWPEQGVPELHGGFYYRRRF